MNAPEHAASDLSSAELNSHYTFETIGQPAIPVSPQRSPASPSQQRQEPSVLRSPEASGSSYQPRSPYSPSSYYSEFTPLSPCSPKNQTFQQLSPQPLPSVRTLEGNSPVYRQSPLPPASSLSNPSLWPGGFHSPAPEYRQQLPQVSSFIPRPPANFYTPAPVNWNQSGHTSVFPPNHSHAHFSPTSQPPTTWQQSEEHWHPQQPQQFQIVRPNTVIQRPYSASQDIPIGNLNISGSPQILRDPFWNSSSPSPSTSTGVSSSSEFYLPPEENALPSASTFTVKSQQTMDKSPRPKRQRHLPVHLSDQEVSLGIRKYRAKSSEAPQNVEAQERTSEDEPSGSGANSVKAEKKKKKSKRKADVIPPPPTTPYSLRQKLPFTLKEGQSLEACDETGTWYKAKVLAVDTKSGHAFIHFNGWNERHDSWVPISHTRLRPLTNEKFSEHPESYSVGNMVIARYRTGLNAAAVIISVVSASQKYQVLFHDATTKYVTLKGIRRMSPFLRTKHQIELDELGRILSEQPEIVSQAQARALEDPAGPPDDQSMTPGGDGQSAQSETGDQYHLSSNPDTPSTTTAADSESAPPFFASKKQKTPKKKLDMVEPILSKPKRQSKKPSKFNDSIVEHVSKKKRKKDDVGESSSGADISETSVVAPQQSVIVFSKTDVITTLQQSGRKSDDQSSIPISLDSSPTTSTRPSVLKSMLESDGGHHPNPAEQHSSSLPSTSQQASVFPSATITHDVASTLPPNATPPPTATQEIVPPKKPGRGRPKSTGIKAPKELIISYDHNDFKCTETDCLKSFRKQKLLNDHLKHYHGLKIDEPVEEVSTDFVSVIPPSKKNRKSSLEVPDPPAKPEPVVVEKIEQRQVAPSSVSPVPSTRKPSPAMSKPSTSSGISEENVLPFPKLTEEKSKRGRKPSTHWKKDEEGNYQIDFQEPPPRTSSKPGKGRPRKERKTEADIAAATALAEADEYMQYIASDHELVHCTCGYELENGFMIQCELCATWQHGHCCNIETQEDVPKPYVCEFCRNPGRVRYSQRFICHDFQFIQDGRLPVFQPLAEDEETGGVGFFPTQAHLTTVQSNRVQYEQMAADSVYCNDQLKRLRRFGRALHTAEEMRLKNDLMLQNMCRSREDWVRLSNAVTSVPEEALEGLNIGETLMELEATITSGGEKAVNGSSSTQNEEKMDVDEPTKTNVLVGAENGGNMQRMSGSVIQAAPAAGTDEGIGNENSMTVKETDPIGMMADGPLDSPVVVGEMNLEKDEQLAKLCMNPDFLRMLKAVNSREEKLTVYLDDLEAKLLEMEKSCDERYGTQFATTPLLAVQDNMTFLEKAEQLQRDLRNMERLAYVLPVATEKPTPPPIVAPDMTSMQEPQSSSRPSSEIPPPPISLKIRLAPKKRQYTRKSEKKPKSSKKGAGGDLPVSPLVQSVTQPP